MRKTTNYGLELYDLKDQMTITASEFQVHEEDWNWTFNLHSFPCVNVH